MRIISDPFESDMPFRFFDYTIGHDHLLIRTSREINQNGAPSRYENIDVICKSVYFLNVPTMFRGLRIEPATDQERAELVLRGPKFPENISCFAFITGGKRFYIVAAGVFIEENTLGPQESSLEMSIGKVRRKSSL